MSAHSATRRHRAPVSPWYAVAGARGWLVFKRATFVAGLLMYVLLIAVFI